MTTPRIPSINAKLWSSRAKYPAYRGGVDVQRLEAELGNAAARLIITLTRPGTYTIKLRTADANGRTFGQDVLPDQVLLEGTLPLPTERQQDVFF